MANQKISQLALAGALTGAEVSEVVQGGVNKQVDLDTEAAFIFASKTTDDLAEGANLYYTAARFDTDFAGKDTDDLSEGAVNFYYTEARFDTSFAGKDTGDLAEGANLYYTAARFDTDFAGKDTDDLSEGAVNFYFTDARAKTAVISQTITNGVTNFAPSEDAVFDALATKQPLDTQLTSLAALVFAGNALKVVRLNAGETDFEFATVTGFNNEFTAAVNGNEFAINNLGTITFSNQANSQIVGRNFADDTDLPMVFIDADDTLNIATGDYGAILFGTGPYTKHSIPYYTRAADLVSSFALIGSNAVDELTLNPEASTGTIRALDADLVISNTRVLKFRNAANAADIDAFTFQAGDTILTGNVFDDPTQAQQLATKNYVDLVTLDAIVNAVDDAQGNVFLGTGAGASAGGGATENTGAGASSLSGVTTGDNNSAIGNSSGAGITTGSRNIALGNLTLGANVSDSVAIGYLAGSGNIANKIVAIGVNALAVNEGDDNVAVGYRALISHTTGAGNVVIGSGTADSVTTGLGNTIIGGLAALTLTDGDNNILIGYQVEPPAASTSNHLNIGDAITGDLTTGDITVSGDFTADNTNQYAIAPSNIAPSGSPFSYNNADGYSEDIIISGGTVSLIEFSRDEATYYDVGFISGIVNLSPGDTVRVTYTVAPTMTKVPR